MPKIQMCSCKATLEEISLDILAYLYRNPLAQDTLEGVVQWWLLDQTVTEQTAHVREALASLVRNGFLIEEAGVGSRSHYRLNPAKRAEIAAMLGGRRE